MGDGIEGGGVLTEDEILDGYEDSWRRAAMAGTKQWHSGKPYTALPIARCAYQVARDDGWRKDIERAWVCPLCRMPALSSVGAITHVNDAHEWTFDQFANKFRSLWHEGKQ
jgi:uncharacterized C2H2 Zn-finger protein